MNSDAEFKQRVESELEWEATIDAASIGVGVREAIVTLSGRVPSYAVKRIVEDVVLRIRGIRGLASDLEVRHPVEFFRTDEDIVRSAAQALLWDPLVTENTVTITVTDGVVTLRGTVEWDCQRTAAEKAVESLMGVRSVVNLIVLRAATICADVESEITAALKKHAEESAKMIAVDFDGANIILSGNVSSVTAKYAIEVAAWKAPGVRAIINHLTAC